MTPREDQFNPRILQSSEGVPISQPIRTPDIPKLDLSP